MKSRSSLVIIASVAVVFCAGVCSGAVVRSESKKWDVSKPIPYRFSNSVDAVTKFYVREILTQFNYTCLKFEEDHEGVKKDHVYFIQDRKQCFQAKVGFRGGRHIVSASAVCPGGYSTTTHALHELGHVLGMYNSVNRPDRDDFVDVKSKNVIKAFRSHFYKESWEDVANEGLNFPFRSIMTMDEYWLSKNGKTTVFPKKSEDTLESRSNLSASDARLLNLAYNCPSPAASGKFILKLKRGRGLPKKAYVVVTVYQQDGVIRSKVLKVKSSEPSQRYFGYKLSFGVQTFKYCRVKVVKGTGRNAKAIFHEQVFHFPQNADSYHKLCEAPGDCDKHLRFKIEFHEEDDGLPPGDQDGRCARSPCQNGGVCENTPLGVHSYHCHCPPGFFRDVCELPFGELLVEVVKGHNLPNLDESQPGEGPASDPFVSVFAQNVNGTVVKRVSKIVRDSNNPNWGRQLLKFDYSSWLAFTLDVYDYDEEGPPRLLLPRRSFEITPTARNGGKKIYKACGKDPECSSYVEFRVSYEEIPFEPPLCPVGYMGYNCTVPYGQLDIRVKGGRNLTNLDASNDALSDPFVQITADGSCLTASVKEKTTHKPDTANPVWDETLRFGTDNFDKIKVKVLDANKGGKTDVIIPKKTFKIFPQSPDARTRLLRVCKYDNCAEYVDLEVTYMGLQQPDIFPLRACQ
ncbi:hypothetical protein NDN08_002058 [Rhodosorus marinus]|uniref:Metalloendopeptidase n=1 Tax=Rhodosorus marinus TaxID=101924 RepID=A0AAV8UVL1_9RHOD|nr:hypothetical protein NDN08_002058 [Rhodosorus marinus]